MATTQAGFFRRSPGGAGLGIISRLLTILAGSALLAVGLMFSLLAVVIAFVAGILVFLYLKWRTRHLEKLLREQLERHAQGSPEAERRPEGLVIEGEVLAAEYDTQAGGPARRLPAG